MKNSNSSLMIIGIVTIFAELLICKNVMASRVMSFEDCIVDGGV